jgi:hypothetical protein
LEAVSQNSPTNDNNNLDSFLSRFISLYFLALINHRHRLLLNRTKIPARERVSLIAVTPVLGGLVAAWAQALLASPSVVVVVVAVVVAVVAAVGVDDASIPPPGSPLDSDSRAGLTTQEQPDTT